MYFLGILLIYIFFIKNKNLIVSWYYDTILRYDTANKKTMLSVPILTTLVLRTSLDHCNYTKSPTTTHFCCWCDLLVVRIWSSVLVELTSRHAVLLDEDGAEGLVVASSITRSKLQNEQIQMWTTSFGWEQTNAPLLLDPEWPKGERDARFRPTRPNMFGAQAGAKKEHTRAAPISYRRCSAW
jgi:hypothetical protein